VALQLPVSILQAMPAWVLLLYQFSKALHVIAYAVLAALCGWLLFPRRIRWMLPLLLIGHGALSEFLQFILSDNFGRTGQWSDVGLNTMGVALGVALSWPWWRAPDAG
jgi:hypothetical protein